MRLIFVALLSALTALTTPSFAETPQNLEWSDLLPEGELELLDELWTQAIPPGLGHNSDDPSLEDTPVQIGTFNVVEELEGKLVRIPGFVLPFEYSESGKITEFLLVPYFGACIHTPPPPPNQMVYVTAKKPADLGQRWNPIWAVGTMRTIKNFNDLGDAAYTLELQHWENFDG